MIRISAAGALSDLQFEAVLVILAALLVVGWIFSLARFASKAELLATNEAIDSMEKHISRRIDDFTSRVEPEMRSLRKSLESIAKDLGPICERLAAAEILANSGRRARPRPGLRRTDEEDDDD